MSPGYHSRRGGPVVIPSIPHLLQGATQVQWTRRESTLQARETDCWRRVTLWLASAILAFDYQQLITFWVLYFWPYLPPFLRYSDLLAKNRKFFFTPSHLAPSFGVTPSNLWKRFTVPEISLPGSRWWRFGDPSLHRFWPIHPFDRQTDRRTELWWLRRARKNTVFGESWQNFWR